jgi:CRP/FNR family transcriptional regulator
MATELNLKNNYKECVFNGLPAFQALSENVRADLQHLCRSRSFMTGQTVVHAGDSAEDIGFVQDGFLRMQKTLPDGRQHIVGLLGQGDMFGRVFDAASHFCIEAATPAKLCMFHRTAFNDIVARSPELERAILMQFMTELDRARDWMMILANHKIRARLAGMLLVFAKQMRSIDHLVTEDGDTITVRIPIGRSDLAHLLGTRPESISRAFHALASDGMLLIHQPDLVTITDPAALAEESGELEFLDGASGGPREQSLARSWV